MTAFVHYMLYMESVWVFIFTLELSNSTLESESLKEILMHFLL